MNTDLPVHSRVLLRSSVGWFCLVMLSSLLAVPTARAQEHYDRTFVVNDAGDLPDLNPADGVPDAGLEPGEQRTLRACLMQAGFLGGRTLILLGSGMAVTNLNGAQVIAADVTVRGGGPQETIIDANWRGRGFMVGTAQDQTIYRVRFESMTIRNGFVVADGSTTIGGAGIANLASYVTVTNVVLTGHRSSGHSDYAAAAAVVSTGPSLVLDRCVIEENHTDGPGGAVSMTGQGAIRRCIFRRNSGGRGAALVNWSGTTRIEGSVFYENRADGDGGAIYNVAEDALTHLENCTLSGNEAAGRGGAIFFASGGGDLRHVTLAFNVAEQGGGGLYHSSARPQAAVRLQACLLAYNQPDNGAGVTTSFLDGDGTVATDDTCNTPADRRGDPLLGPLGDHGGGTYTHPLFAGSLALDTVAAGSSLATDQRGTVRPQDGDGDQLAWPDAGAYEAEGLPPLARPMLDLVITADDLGEVVVGAAGTTVQVSLVNAGPLALEVTAIGLSSSTDFTLDLAGGPHPSGALPLVLEVGQHRTFLVRFSPQSAGDFATVLAVTSNDAEAPIQELSLTGRGRIGVPELDTIPLIIEFGSTLLYDIGRFTLTLTNRGDGVIQFGNLALDSDSAAGFSIVADSVSGTRLEPFAAASVILEFAPRVAGAAQGRLLIAWNAPESAANPFEVPIHAEGVTVPIVGGGPAWTFDGGYGGSAVQGVAIDSGGRALGAGWWRTSPAANDSMAFIVESFGSWTNTMEAGPVGGDKDDSTDQFLAIAVDSADNILAAGVRSGSFSVDGYHQALVVRKTSPGGETLWERIYHDFAWNAGRAVALDGQDNILVVGSAYTSFTVNFQWVILKYSPDGDLMEGFPIKENFSDLLSPWDVANGVAIGPGGRFVVVGQRAAAEDDLDWHVRAYESSGTFAWEHTYASVAGGDDVALDAVYTVTGDVVVAGYRDAGGDGTLPNRDWWVVCYTPYGQIRWEYQYESESGGDEMAVAVSVDSIGQVLVGGNVRDAEGRNQWRIVQLESALGTEMTEQTWTSSGGQTLSDLDVRDGRMAIGGTAGSPGFESAVLFTGRYVGEPDLAFEPVSVAFGDLLPKETGEQTVRIRNRSDRAIVLAALEVEDALPPPFRLLAGWGAGLTLNPGDHADLQITFSPAEIGDYSAEVVVREDVTDGRSWRLPVNGAAVLLGPFGREIYRRIEGGGDGPGRGMGVALNSDGEPITVGYLSGPTNSAQGTSALILSHGEPGWRGVMEEGEVVQGVKDDSDDRFYDVAVDSNDDVIVVGQQSGSWNTQGYHQAMVTRKYSREGELIWSRTYQDFAWNTARGVAMDAADSIYVVGNAFTSLNVYHQWAILKYDPAGDLQPGFPIFYDQGGLDSPWDVPHDIATRADGGFVVVGQVVGGVDNLDWHVRHYDAGGHLMGVDTYDRARGRHDVARSVAVDRNGDFIVGGAYNRGSDNAEQADYDWLLIKYDGHNRQRLWTFTFESAPGRSELCQAVAVDGIGRVLAAGVIEDEAGLLHGCLLQLGGTDGALLGRMDWADPSGSGIEGIAVRRHHLALTGFAQVGRYPDVVTQLHRVPPLQFQNVTVQDATMTIGWRNQTDPVTLLFSPSAAAPTWTPVAEGLLDQEWTGPRPTSGAGYFRVVEP